MKNKTKGYTAFVLLLTQKTDYTKKIKHNRTYGELKARFMLMLMIMKPVSIIASPFYEKQPGYKSSLFGFLIYLLDLRILMLVGEL